MTCEKDIDVEMVAGYFPPSNSTSISLSMTQDTVTLTVTLTEIPLPTQKIKIADHSLLSPVNEYEVFGGKIKW